jgi:hypothetical protein
MIEKDALAHPIRKDILDFTIEEAVEHGTFNMYLPYQWSPKCDGLYGDAPKDPLTIYASLDVTNGSDCITIKTTIRSLLIDTYELLVNLADGKLDKEAQKIFKDFRDSLNKEIDWIDEMLEKST